MTKVISQLPQMINRGTQVESHKLLLVSFATLQLTTSSHSTARLITLQSTKTALQTRLLKLWWKNKCFFGRTGCDIVLKMQQINIGQA
jgi:hypothetical protein